MLLRGMLETYSLLQRLYHKAILPHVQRHASLAKQSEGLAYALLCEVLGQQPAKQQGDVISKAELQQLQQQVKQLPAEAANQPLAQLAFALCSSLEKSESIRTLVACVMPDMYRLIGQGWFALGAEELGTLFPGPTQGVASFVLKGLMSMTDANDATKVQEFLLQACQPYAVPPTGFKAASLLTPLDTR
jgi:hypothetical protein